MHKETWYSSIDWCMKKEHLHKEENKQERNIEIGWERSFDKYTSSFYFQPLLKGGETGS